MIYFFRLMDNLETLKETETLEADATKKEKKECYAASVSSTSEPTEPAWELLIEKQNFKVWRKPVPNSYLYQYKGTSYKRSITINLILI